MFTFQETSFCKDDAIEASYAVILGAGAKGINASSLQGRSLRERYLLTLGQVMPQLSKAWLSSLISPPRESEM